MQILIVFLSLWLLAPLALFAWWLKKKKIPFRYAFLTPETPLIGIRIMPYQEEKETDILKIAGALAPKNSSVPIARALGKALAANNITLPETQYLKEFSGLGAGAVIENRAVVMGTLDFMNQCSLTLPPALVAETAREKSEGRCLTYLGWEGEVRAALIFEGKILGSPGDLAECWRWRGIFIDLAAIAGAVLMLLAASIFLGSCERSPRAIRGTMSLANENYRHMATKPNAVCYLIVKDQWGTPVAIRRWLNPKFPLQFRITSDDRLVLVRPWKGPYQLQAYLFESNNTERELPPPANAAKALSDAPVYPSVTGSHQLSLR